MPAGPRNGAFLCSYLATAAINAAATAAATAAAASADAADATVAAVSEHERQLKYSKWRTYQCSHLLENIKHEFLDVESRVDDHYFLEKVRILEIGYNQYQWAARAAIGVQYVFLARLVHIFVPLFGQGSSDSQGSSTMATEELQ